MIGIMLQSTVGNYLVNSSTNYIINTYLTPATLFYFSAGIGGIGVILKNLFNDLGKVLISLSVIILTLLAILPVLGVMI